LYQKKLKMPPKNKKSTSRTYNRFSALEALDEVFELQPGIFAGGVGIPQNKVESTSSSTTLGNNNNSSFFPQSSFLQNKSFSSSSNSSSTTPFGDLVSALPIISGERGDESSWNFGTLASGLSISAAESEERAAIEAQKKADLAAANVAMAAAVHSGREREEFRSRLLKGRLDLSTNIRRRKLSKLKSAESYDDRVKARFGGSSSTSKREIAMPIKALFKKQKTKHMSFGKKGRKGKR
jgi:hypothetical protein